MVVAVLGHVFGPFGSISLMCGSISLMCGSGSGSFPFLINVFSGIKFNTRFSRKNLIFKKEDNVPVGKLLENFLFVFLFFCILKVTKKRIRIQSWIRVRIH
jgi:hypothetical protein